jgi:hypothetical protein
MLRDRLLLGVWIGLVAAAATAGALVGFGWARGAPLHPLNTVAHVLVGSRAFYVLEAHHVVTPAGMLVHVVSLAAWGMLFSLVLGRARGARAWAVAFVFAAVVAIIDFVLLPQRFSPGFEATLTRGEVVIVYGVMAAAMAVAVGKLGVESGDRGPRTEEARF